MPDRLTLFLGKPIPVNEINLYSPTIEEISKIGEIMYSIYITLATFNKESVIKHLYEVSDDDYESIIDEDDYEILTAIPWIREETAKAFSFFAREQVFFNSTNLSFVCNDKVLVERNNYTEVVDVVKRLNGLQDEIDQMKFKNDKAKQMYMQMIKHENKLANKSTENSLGLKDMLSILCNAEGNGINVFNVQSLTIYQVYEHYERLNMKESHKRILPVWANGHLGEANELPEWIAKSKL